MAAAPSVFLVRALEKILNDKDTRKSQHAQLKKVCIQALDDVKQKAKKEGERKDGSTGKSIASGGADAYFKPFELACKSKSPRIISTALDCLQKLIAPGHLTGSSQDPDNPQKLLVDRMVDTVCSCFQGQNTDEGVQLQIIKAVLTMVSVPTCHVHEASLMQIIRTCFSIYLASKNQINQTTAKATLTQMLSITFQKMEQHAQGREKLTSSSASIPLEQAHSQGGHEARGDDAASLAETASNASDTETRAVIAATAAMDVPTEEDLENELEEETGPEDSAEQVARQLVKEVVEKAVDEVNAEILVESVKEGLARQQSADTETATANANGDLKAADSTIASSRASAGSLNMEVLSDVEGLDAMEGVLKPGKKLKFTHITQKDAFLVFRSLCKLSMKSVESADPKSPELSSTVLSLELLLGILQNSGPFFRTNELFVRAIKQYLCVSLSKNGVSNVPQVFEVSLSIFLTLLQSFKYHLKMQIEVFFKEVFLNILQSANSSYHHKWLVMQALTRISGDAQCIVDIYLNYDCDLSLANIFERLVRDIAHVAQGHKAIALGNPTPAQEKALQLKGIECFVSILRCMVEWSRELYVHPGAPHASATTESQSHRGSVDNIQSAVSGGYERASPSPFHPRPSSTVHDGTDPVDAATPVESGSIDNPEMVEVRKKRKDLMEQGLLKFTQNPKKGMKFLQENGLIGPEASDVAKFFHSDDRLDMVAIGEYLGENNKFCIDVMYSYCDQMDFSGIDFVPALRLFLSGFRLPGESQKIDRLMEKYAARYCENNASLQLFASADTAYVLAYSIIMLATDLHSTKIKRQNKMTKEQYIKMNRGINDQKDLPPEYLEGIYDEIARQAITLRPTGKTAKALMEDRSHIQTSFTSATHIDHVRPMFKLAWTPFLAALSLSLRDADDMQMVTLCLDGFRCAIRIASIFNMQLERNAFVQSLAKFTLLTNTGLSEMKPKNIETIKTLIAVAHSEGNYLQESWHEILNVVSQLELAQLIGTGVKTRYISSGATDGGGAGGPMGIRDSTAAANELLEGARGKMDQKTLATIQESMGETSSQSVVVAVDRIFTSSSLLDGDAIVDFVRALCSVSVAELESRVVPRMFCLTKIVEISYYNMGRIRLEWSRIWAVLGEYFNKVGCNPNDDIAFFAIDSLRQLSIKFLEKGELANFRFQKDFLKPFEYVMKRTGSLMIRDMIVSCTEQMVSKQVHNIKSGWVNIFAVFHKAASDRDEKLVEKAFFRITKIFRDHFAATIETFQDAIKCLSEFACNTAFPDTGMEAIQLIDLCGQQLAVRPELFGEANEETVDAQDRVWVKGWFPVLVELSYIVSRCKLDVRTRALTVMFNIMKSYGHQFTIHWWKDLFSVVFRIFDNTMLPEAQKSEWMTTTCPHALMAIVNVFTQYFDKLVPVLLDDLFGQFCWCAQQENKDLAAAGLDCLESFVLSNGGAFDEQIWDKTIECVEKIFEDTVPHKLLTWQPHTTQYIPHSPISIPRRADLAARASGSGSAEISRRSTDTGGAQDSPASIHRAIGQQPFVQPASVNTDSKLLEGSSQENRPEAAAEGAALQVHSESLSVMSDVSQPAEVADDASQLSSQQQQKEEQPQQSQPENGKSLRPKQETSLQPQQQQSTISDAKKKEVQANADEAQRRLFATLTIRCQVQRALIRTVDHILFSSVTSKEEDTRLIHAASHEVSHPRTGTPQPSPMVRPAQSGTRVEMVRTSSGSAMVPLLNAKQLLSLVNMLLKSHDFAKSFNQNEDLRTKLWKAGFMDRLKPNMWSQEVASIACALRLLFLIYEAERFSSHWDAVELQLMDVWRTAIAYFCLLSSQKQRHEWLGVLLLLFDRLGSMQSDRFECHLLSEEASILFDMLPLELDPEIRCTMRNLLKDMHLRFCAKR
ncbi:brefeldin A-inhibited guanine nucleotide-exchange protein 1-like isoform X3 [Sycon ciliatum]|uniref:brefeldin A-inhibited guanine nucleotide-exchange protein 1-like isoform X3 n=1 Tax=Sycon ciliatum TaxID=27933 RepID=UPI0031F6F936